MRKKPVSGKNTWIIFIIAALAVVLLSGCPQSQGNDQPQSDNNGNGDGIVSDTSNETPGQDEVTEPVANENGEAAEEEEDYHSQILHGPVTGFQPTEEQPFAPESPEASGVEDVPDGELALVASLKGTGDQVPLEDGAEVAVDERLLVQCSIVNKTDGEIEFSFVSSQKFDIFVTDQDGTQVYQWSQDRRFAQVLGIQYVESGGVWSHELTIPIDDGGISPGTYDIEVVLTGLPELITSAKGIVVALDR